MYESTTSNTRVCVECDAPAGPIGHKCERCYDRSDSSDRTHELALVEDTLRHLATTDGERWHRHAYAVQQRAIAEKVITDGADPRIENLWYTLWRALDGDIERDETWGLFIDAIPGIPDHRTKTYSGTVTLRFYFSEVEVSGDVDKYEIESAILEEIRGDLEYGYEDECEVDYEEE